MCLGEKSRLIMSVFVTLFLKDTRQRQKYSKKIFYLQSGFC